MSRVATVDAPISELVGFLVFLIGWDGGGLPVYLDGARTPATVLRRASAQAQAAELHRRAQAWDMDENRQVEIGLPCNSRVGGVGETSVLWATVDTRDQAWRCARRFRPPPSMVLRLGKSARRLVLWGLKETVPSFVAEHSNKRIAYALHAPYRMVDPDKLRIPVPGTCLRVGRQRPAAVLCTLMDPTAAYARSQVDATLKDPPVPYMERLRRGEVKR